VGSPLGPSGYTTSGVPGIVTGNDGSLPSMVSNTQANVTATYQAQVQESPGWNGASSSLFGLILGGFSSVAANVTAAIDDFLANICDAITGLTGGFIDLSSWSASLRADASSALSGVSTISSGVTGNITGATSSSSASAVGTAVSTLNSTVQTSAQPPTLTIINTTQNYTQPAGAKSFTFNIFGDGGSGGRGPTVSGGGYPAGSGAIGGWEQVTVLASVLPSTFKCNIGPGHAGASTDNTAGTAGIGSSITNTAGTITYAAAGGGGPGLPIPTTVTLPTTAYNGAPGTGNMTWALVNNGGCGGERGPNASAGYAGSPGSSGAGGAGGASGGNAGGNGVSNASTAVPGSGGCGGGGGDGGAAGNAGAGGNGGTPSGGGGGGGGFYTAGVNGNGGTSMPGQIWAQANF